MDSKLVVDKIDMLVSDVNPLFITVLIFLPFVKYNTVSDSTLFLIEYKRNF